MMTRSEQTLLGIGAVLALIVTQAACSSDADNGGGAAGAAQAGRSGGGAPGVAGSSSGVAGFTSGVAGSAGSGTGGSAAGSGGSAAGSGGSSAGSAGSSAGSGGSSAGSGGSSGASGSAGRGGAGGASGSGGAGGRGGASGASGASGAGGGSAGSGGGGSVPFSAVSSILMTACAGSSCHGGSMHINLTNATGLYDRLTMPLPEGNPHCKGATLISKTDPASSFLPKLIKGESMCKNGTGMETIPRMPNMCSTSGSNPRACLTTAQIKTIDDWVAGGAPGPT